MPFLKCLRKVGYTGMHDDIGKAFSAVYGETVEVGEKCAARLKEQFPEEWEASTKDAIFDPEGDAAKEAEAAEAEPEPEAEPEAEAEEKPSRRRRKKG